MPKVKPLIYSPDRECRVKRIGGDSVDLVIETGKDEDRGHMPHSAHIKGGQGGVNEGGNVNGLFRHRAYTGVYDDILHSYGSVLLC